MLIPSFNVSLRRFDSSLSRRVNANSQLHLSQQLVDVKLIKKGEC